METDPKTGEKVQPLMMKSDLPPSHPLLIFTNAISYQLAAQMIETHTHRSLFLFVVQANLSFSLELYIKCLREYRGIPLKKEHNTTELFPPISSEDREKIAAFTLRSLKSHPDYQSFTDSGVPFDIDSIIKRTDDLFVCFRYWHELKIPQRDDTGYAGNPGLGNLCDGFRDFFFDKHPEWKQRIDEFQVNALRPENVPSPTSPAR
jgi:hypothetical protein